MKTGTKKYSKTLMPYINDIQVFEEDILNAETFLPFFADGYPGIVFNKALNGVYLLHKEEKLSEIFIYGQTIRPIQLQIEGAYKMIIFQMFPFALRILLGIEPKTLNDDCYDLSQLFKSIDCHAFKKLKESTDTHEQIVIITHLLNTAIDKSAHRPDESVILAINLILQFKGKISITELRKKLFVTERTLERRFVKEIGVSPKILSKIIQFQFSLHQIRNAEESKMINIVYENGFFDHSHFIRSFKKFTGMTPSKFENLPAFANFLPLAE